MLASSSRPLRSSDRLPPGSRAAFAIATITAFVGGRPGMISGATAAMALLMVTLVKDHGLEYLLAATILTGILQILAGALRLGNLMRFVSRSVITGFVNALAILIFMAQLPELIGVTWEVYAMVGLARKTGHPKHQYLVTPALRCHACPVALCATYHDGRSYEQGPMVAAGLAILYLFPYLTKLIPSPLVTIVVLTATAIALDLDIRTVGDMGELPDTLPIFLFPDIPLNWETLTIIFPISATLAVVGLLESLMTASIVDDLTDSNSNKNRECVGQGVANVGSGFLGGMAGCAMIGQAVINIKSGGRGRLSTLASGVFLILMVVFAGEWVSMIPMAALVAVMIMVSIGTFNWASIRNLREHPLAANVVMLSTVVVVVFTHDLAIGVLVGVLLSGFFFAHKVGQILHVASMSVHEGRLRVYVITGQVFFASADRFVASFDYKEVIEKVRIDVSRAHFWDITAVSALDKVVIKFRREGTEVEIVGLNQASATLVDRFAVHDKPDAVDQLMGH